jgi:hypothetical protein
VKSVRLSREYPLGKEKLVVLVKFVHTGVLQCPHVGFQLVVVDLVAGHTAAPDEPSAAEVQGLPPCQHA